MKNIVTAALTIVAVCLWLGCAQGDKMVQLRFKFGPETELTYNQVNRNAVEVIRGDSTLYEYEVTYDAVVSYLTDEVLSDTSWAVRELVTWTWTEPQKEDSTKLDTLSREREIEMTMYASGRVTDLEAIDSTQERRLEYIKQYYEQGLPVFPSGEHAPGYSWTQTTTVMIPDNPAETTEASTTFTIKSLARESGYDCAVIEFDGRMFIPVDLMAEDSAKITGVDRINATGVIYFAYREGFIVMQRERWVIDGDREKHLKDGSVETFQVAVQIDSDHTLVQRN